MVNIKALNYVYVGRFSPFHLGHETVIKHFEGGNLLVLIGSCATNLSDTLYFTYHQRKTIIKAVHPSVDVCGLPDYRDIDSDPEFRQWHENLWDIIRLKWPTANKDNTVFVGGSEKDLFWATAELYNKMIINREELGISGTMIRAKLKANEDISQFISPKALDLILYYYNVNKKFIK